MIQQKRKIQKLNMKGLVMRHKYLTINERNKILIISIHCSTIYHKIKRCHSIYDASIT